MEKIFSKKKTKKWSKICSICFGVLLTCSALFSGIFLNFTPQNMLAPETKAETAPVTAFSHENDTAFLFEPTSSVTLSENLTVTLDQKSGNLLALSGGEILQDQTSSAHGATDIFSLDGQIVLVCKNEVSTPSSKIIVLDQTTKEKLTVEFAGDTAPLLSDFDHVKTTRVDDSLHMLFYSEDFSSGAIFVILTKIDDETFASSEPKTISFTDQLLENNFESFKSLNLCHDDAVGTYAIVHSGNTFFSFVIPTGTNMVSNISTEENNFSVQADAKVHTFNFDGTNYVVLQNGTTLACHPYTLTGSSFRVDFDAAATLSVSLSSIDSVNVWGSILTVTSTTDKQVLLVRIGIETSSLIMTEISRTTNPEVSVSLFENGNLKFVEVTNAATPAALRETPYSSDTITEILPQSNLTWIGSGYTTSKDGQTHKVVGHEYFMFTDSSGVNHYGFLEIDRISELETPAVSERSYVYVRGGSKIFKFPSRTITDDPDDLNEVLLTTTDLSRFEVTRDISAFYYHSGNGNNFFFEIELADGTVGYVQDINVDKNQGGSLVQTNAVVLRTSVIYTNPQIDASNTIFTLHEATRVRILENRRGNEKYTKISFNDDSGNYYTGYILSENIKADSWSSMQLIGLTLVVFSIILLGVILIVKNRLSHE